jgi:glutamine synthetase
VTVEGAPWPYCPRTILRNAVSRAVGQGYRLKMGIELEFFLIKDVDGRIVLLTTSTPRSSPVTT